MRISSENMRRAITFAASVPLYLPGRLFVRWERLSAGTMSNWSSWRRPVRRYAEAMGALEKTDRIVASIIAKCLEPTAPPSLQQQRLKTLATRLGQVTSDLIVQKQRRAAAHDAEMIESIDEIIARKSQSRSLEGEIASMIDDDRR